MEVRGRHLVKGLGAFQWREIVQRPDPGHSEKFLESRVHGGKR